MFTVLNEFNSFQIQKEIQLNNGMNFLGIKISILQNKIIDRAILLSYFQFHQTNIQQNYHTII